jgi:hypothetical protein
MKPYPLKQAGCSESGRLSPARAMTYAREPRIAEQMNTKEEVDGLNTRGFPFLQRLFCNNDGKERRSIVRFPMPSISSHFLTGHNAHIIGVRLIGVRQRKRRLIGDTVKKETNGWDFFDRIYCISLEEREDRRQAAAASFSKVGLSGKVEFVIVKRHPFNVEQGMYESHMTCLRKGLEAGAERIVVFEDDIVFDRFDADRFKQSIQFLAEHPDWKVLLFGALIRSSRRTTNPFIQKVGYQSLAHAYALNRPYAETLAYQPWQGIIIDTLFRPLTEHLYAVYPMFAFQNDFASDNEKYQGLEHFRRLCGGLERIQKVNEFYQRHKPGVIAAHIMILLSLLIVLLSR